MKVDQSLAVIVKRSPHSPSMTCILTICQQFDFERHMATAFTHSACSTCYRFFDCLFRSVCQALLNGLSKAEVRHDRCLV